MLKNLKSITVLVLVLILGTVCLSAQQWEVVKSAKWQAKFNDVFFLDNSNQVGLSVHTLLFFIPKTAEKIGSVSQPYHFHLLLIR